MSIIEDNVFVKYEGNSSIVDIPQNIKVIKEEAFDECTSLREIHFPDTLEKIEKRAFRYCINLKILFFPSSLKVVEDEAFSECASLEFVSKNTENVNFGKDVFKNCTSLVYSEIAKENISDNYVIEGNDLIKYKGSGKIISIPENINTIKESAFEDCTTLEEIYFPKNLLKIEKKAFRNCKNLKAISLPNSVITIEDQAFAGCTSISFFEMKNGITTLGDRVFEDCINIRNLILSKNLSSIGEDTFCFANFYINPDNQYFSTKNGALYNKDETDLIKCSCENLKYNGKLSDNLTRIKTNAFRFSGFNYIDLPDNIKEIKERAFSYCLALREIDLPESIEIIEKKAFEQCGKLKNITFPYENLREIGDEAFYDTKIETADIPISVTHIGNKAFPNTTDIKVHDFNKFYSSFRGSLYNKEKTKLITFSDSMSKRVEKLLDSLIYIDDAAFGKNKRVKYLHIPSKVSYLNSAALKKCIVLREINVDQNNKTFASEDGVLYTKDMTKLLKVPNSMENYILKDSVKEIDEWAFFGCSKLKSITFPVGMTTFKTLMIHECKMLKEINLPSTVTAIIDNYDSINYFKYDNNLYRKDLFNNKNKFIITFNGNTYNNIEDLPLKILKLDNLN